MEWIHAGSGIKSEIKENLKAVSIRLTGMAFDDDADIDDIIENGFSDQQISADFMYIALKLAGTEEAFQDVEKREKAYEKLKKDLIEAMTKL